MTADTIVIRHTGMPQALDGDVAGYWPDVASALLEGPYDTWVRALGSGPQLQTRLVAWRNGVVEFRHGP